MSRETTYRLSYGEILSAKARDISQLIKLRLNTTVVFSAGMGYLLAVPQFEWIGFLLIMLGGFLITGSANALNEVIEKDYDRLMDRTMNRPLPAERMTVTEAILIAGLFGVSGIFILAYTFNILAALLGALSLFSYAFIYTPLKRYTPFAVFVGAIPGALPPLIGWVAASGTINEMALVVFGIQFIWQFPHFWAIAWVAHNDYQKAGYNLLPSSSGKTKMTAIYNVIYIIVLIPLTLVPYFMGEIDVISALVIGIAGSAFLYQAIQLYQHTDDANARKLMFQSMFYLPVVLLALVFG